ncbi:MAG: hypothetical protein ACRELY_11535 [Polyangiaceae bacterium]
MTAQTKANSTTGKTTEKRAYPGATLRHLGSVRDVTLLKTKNAFESGPRRT